MGDLRVTLRSENKPITLSLPHSQYYLQFSAEGCCV